MTVALVGYFSIGLVMACGFTLRLVLLDKRKHPTGTPEAERAASGLLDTYSAETDMPVALVFVICLVAWPLVFFGLGAP